MRIQFAGALEFAAGFFLVALLLQRQSQFKMRGGIIRGRCQGGAELRDSPLEVAEAAQAAPGIGGEKRGLQICLALGELDAKARFGGATLGIAHLTQNSRERSVRTSGVRLEADGFAQRSGGFAKFALLL